LKSSRQIDADDAAVRRAELARRPLRPFSYTGAPLSNMLWWRRAKKDVSYHHTELNYVYSLLTVLFFKLNYIEEIKS
jgi:hypothetical protein